MQEIFIFVFMFHGHLQQLLTFCHTCLIYLLIFFLEYFKSYSKTSGYLYLGFFFYNENLKRET